MSFMFEVYYCTPTDAAREERISVEVELFGGRLTCRNDPDPALSRVSEAVCLTYEFDALQAANAAAERCRATGEHVEGPCSYGPG